MNQYEIDSDLETQCTEPDQDEFLELLNRIKQLLIELEQYLNSIQSLKEQERSNMDQENHSNHDQNNSSLSNESYEQIEEENQQNLNLGQKLQKYQINCGILNQFRQQHK